MTTLNVTAEQLKHALWLQEVAVLAHKAGINGPAPPGFVAPWLLNPNYVVENRQVSMYIIDCVFFILAVIMVLMRIYTRVFIIHKFGLDDWCMVLALISVAAFTTLQFCFLIYGGVGYHIWDVTPEQLQYCFKFIYFHLIGYTWSITLIKMSILFLYERIIPTTHPMRKVLTGFMVIQIVYFLVSEFTFIFQCSPIAGGLDFDFRMHGAPKCIGLKPMLYSFCIIHIFMDLALLILPIRVIWELQMPIKRKLSTLSLFVIGAIGCICAVMRVVTIAQLLDGFDFTWTIYDPGMWGLLELTIGIICACIPPSKLLLEKIYCKIAGVKFRPFGSSRDAPSSYKSGDSSLPYNEKRSRSRSPAPRYSEMFNSTEKSLQSINKSVLMSQTSERVDSFIISQMGPIQPMITTHVEGPEKLERQAEIKRASFDTISRPTLAMRSFETHRPHTMIQIPTTNIIPPSPQDFGPPLGRAATLEDLVEAKRPGPVAASCPPTVSALEKAMQRDPREGSDDLTKPILEDDNRPPSGFSVVSGTSSKASLEGKPVSGIDWV
ncbi:hypothetical protein Dda_9031 [Drechslerella dactyloides]|uniref:Rhodopsin domain-containing protein n=1 Tax=Drechslerella dactyloides TaxID=74499 RepID=A0AAD6NEM6_DREDA|nr:hypothetical protein Dda_9031 [Drechslerella dactyloides]